MPPLLFLHGCKQGRIQVLRVLKHMQFLGPSLRKNTKLGTKVNIYLGPISGPWKGSVQLKGPEA